LKGVGEQRRRGYWENEMSKEIALRLLMLLSALESWGFSTGKMFPDFLHEELNVLMDELRKELL
jgi:hypothetical protein